MVAIALRRCNVGRRVFMQAAVTVNHRPGFTVIDLVQSLVSKASSKASKASHKKALENIKSIKAELRKWIRVGPPRLRARVNNVTA
jgi:hypothetical protein